VTAAITEIRTSEYSYVFSPYAEPIATVQPGEVLDVYTEDAFGSRVQSTDDLPSQVLEFPKVNPQTGPISVEGAEKGDTLAVHILEIEPTRDFAASAFIPYFGGLTATDKTALLNEPLPEQVFIYPLRDGAIELPRGIRVPYEPFLGTLATSPELEAISTLVPGPFGGNMDVADVCPGNVVRLPVWVEGA
jgi:acetamidase/formamidase